jgi:hypothetical protein
MYFHPQAGLKSSDPLTCCNSVERRTRKTFCNGKLDMLQELLTRKHLNKWTRIRDGHNWRRKGSHWVLSRSGDGEVLFRMRQYHTQFQSETLNGSDILRDQCLDGHTVCKVKLPLCLITYAPRHEDAWASEDSAEVSGQLYAPAASSPEKQPPILIV